MGRWAAEWVFGDPTDEDCDGLSIIWRLHQHAIPAKLPATRTIVHVVLTGAGGAEGWLEIDPYRRHRLQGRPGPRRRPRGRGRHGADAPLAGRPGELPQLVADGHARLLGPSRLARAFPTWFEPSAFTDELRRGELRLQTHERAIA